MASVEFSLFHRLSARKPVAMAPVCAFDYFDKRILQYSGFVSKYKGKIYKKFAFEATKMAAVFT